VRRAAESRGWKIRDFRRPVRLRTRFASSVPRPNPPVAVAVGVAAVAAVLGWLAVRQRVAVRRAA
jgi:hypothetical protein